MVGATAWKDPSTICAPQTHKGAFLPARLAETGLPICDGPPAAGTRFRLYRRFDSNPELAHGQPHVLATAAHLSRDLRRFSSFQLSAAAKHPHQQLPQLPAVPSLSSAHTDISAQIGIVVKIGRPALRGHTKFP